MLMTFDLDALFIRSPWLAWLVHSLGFFSWLMCAEVNQLILRINRVLSDCHLDSEETLFQTQDRLAWGILKHSLMDGGPMRVPSALHALLSREMRKQVASSKKRSDAYGAWLRLLNRDETWRQWQGCVSKAQQVDALKSQWLCWGGVAKLSVAQSLEMWQALTALSEYFDAVVHAGRWRFFWWRRVDCQMYQQYALASLKVIDAVSSQLQGFMQYAIAHLTDQECVHPVKRLTEALVDLGVVGAKHLTSPVVPDVYPDNHLTDAQRHHHLQILLRDADDVSDLQGLYGGRISVVLWQGEWLWMPSLAYPWLLNHAHRLPPSGQARRNAIAWMKTHCCAHAAAMQMIGRVLHHHTELHQSLDDDGLALWGDLKAMHDALEEVSAWISDLQTQSRIAHYKHRSSASSLTFLEACQGWWMNWLSVQSGFLHQQCLEVLLSIMRISTAQQHAWLRTPRLFQMKALLSDVMMSLEKTHHTLRWPEDMSWLVLHDFYQLVVLAYRLEMMITEGLVVETSAVSPDVAPLRMAVDVMMGDATISVAEALQGLVQSWVQQSAHPAAQCLLQMASRHVTDFQTAWTKTMRSLVFERAMDGEAVGACVDRLLRLSDILSALNASQWVSDRMQLLFLLYLKVHVDRVALSGWSELQREGLGGLLKMSMGRVMVLGQSVRDVLVDLDVFYTHGSWKACHYKASQLYTAFMSWVLHAWCDRTCSSLDGVLKNRLAKDQAWHQASWPWFLALCDQQAAHVQPDCLVQTLCLSGSDAVHVRQLSQRGLDVHSMLTSRASLVAMRHALGSRPSSNVLIASSDDAGELPSHALQPYVETWSVVKAALVSHRLAVNESGMDHLMCLYHLLCIMDDQLRPHQVRGLYGAVLHNGLGLMGRHSVGVRGCVQVDIPSCGEAAMQEKAS